MKYSTASNEWQMVSVVGDDKLTTKGDLLVYNTVDSETRLGVGTNNKVITANSSATNGLDWQYVAGDSIRMGSDAAGDTLYFNGTDYARLAKGSASQVLTMNSGATAPEWAASSEADMGANTVKVRDADSSGAPSNKTVADTQILIGDGTGFTAAALSGDVTMANTGAVTIANDAVEQAMIADDAVGADQLAGNSVVSASIVDGAIVNADINASAAIAASKLDSNLADRTADAAWTGSQRATSVTDNDGSYDMNAGQNFITTPSGNFTLTFTNITNGQSGFVKLINSGGHTVSLHSNSKGDANIATTVSTAGTYLLSYFSDGTDVWLTNSAIYA